MSHTTQNRSFWRRSSSQFLGLVLKKWNPKQQKQAMQEQVQVRPSSGSAVYPHMLILRPHTVRYSTNVASLSDESAACGPRKFVRFWASGAAKFPKMWDSTLWTPINCCAKFDAASFILGGEIRNRTNTDTQKIHKPQTVNDISTPCQSACVDNKMSANKTHKW